MLRLVFWLALLTAAVLWGRWLDREPPDPLQTAASPTTPGNLLIFSRLGWLTEPPAGRRPAGLPACFGLVAPIGQRSAAFADMLHVLTLAETRNLDEPRVATEHLIWAGPHKIYNPEAEPLETWIYPTWDLADLLEPGNPRSSFKQAADFFCNAALDSTSGGTTVLGTAGSHAMIRGLFETCRRGRYPLEREAGPRASRPNDRTVAGHTALPVGAGDDPPALLRPFEVMVQSLTLKTLFVPCAGLAMGAGERQGHVELEQVLHDSHWIRTARALREGSPRRRQQACLAALSDDDPLVACCAVQELLRPGLRQTGVPPGEWAAQVLEGCVRHRLDPADLRVGKRLLAELPAAEAAPLLARLTRTTPEIDRVSWLVVEGLGSSAAEVRRVAQAVVLERLPKDALPTYGVYEDWADSCSPQEREQFLADLHDRLLEAWATWDDKPRVQAVAQEAVDLVISGFVRGNSPAAGRLEELLSRFLRDEE